MTGLRVAVDWSECFKLNGPLDTYVLLENGLLTYEGQQNKRDLGTRNKGGESSDSASDILVSRAARLSAGNLSLSNRDDAPMDTLIEQP